MTIKVPPPPTNVSNPQFVRFEKGEEIARLHSDAFAGNSFNPCGGAETRFAPIYDEDDDCIPSLYGATTLAAAIFETVFHDSPVNPGATSYSVPMQNIEDREYTLIETKRDLNLLSLRAPDLKNYGINRAELIESSAEHYEETALWAQAFHQLLPDIDGLIWTSRQCDPDSCILLFGDRVDESDLKIVETAHALDADEFLLEEIQDAGARAGIKISLAGL